MNKAIIIQHCMSAAGWFAPVSGIFYDMSRLTMQRHAAYARVHNFDYWLMMGDIHPEQRHGAWAKIWLIKDALEKGYEYVAWIDSDAAIMDGSVDLRDALPAGKYIGAVSHYADWFPSLQIERHCNCGVLYVRNSPLTLEFMDEWCHAYPGKERWAEQGTFNDLIVSDKYKDLFCIVDDRFNATVNVNLVNNPTVKGWHGVMPVQKRLAMMQAELKDDFIKFKV